jgi:malonyl-CoA O-methyltransferase
MINKDLVRSRFSKSLENYQENAKIQKKMAERLFCFIQNKQPKKILEIGCGTGFLTKIINDNLIFEDFIAIDIVENCEEYISNINSHIKFIAADIENFIKDNDNQFDLIISNASLQWVEDFEGVIKALSGKLTKNGELIFSTFGNENFREIYNILGMGLKILHKERTSKHVSKFIYRARNTCIGF